MTCTARTVYHQTSFDLAAALTAAYVPGLRAAHATLSLRPVRQWLGAATDLVDQCRSHRLRMQDLRLCLTGHRDTKTSIAHTGVGKGDRGHLPHPLTVLKIKAEDVQLYSLGLG